MKRKDGVALKNVDPMYTLVPYIMKERNDAMNMTTVYIPEEPMQEYINRKRKEGVAISHMALILGAFVRVVAEYPEINRFIINSRIYARKELSASMVVLRAGNADSTMTKLTFEPDDTIFEVNDRINTFITRERQETQENDVDKLMHLLVKWPIVTRIAVNALMWMDKHGLMPMSLINSLPFHASVCITNLASIRTQWIYHHIYNFGSISNFLAMGLSEKRVEEQKDGSFKTVKYMPIGVVMDERVASGQVYGSAFRKMRHYLAHPELLEEKPAVVKRDF